MRPQNGWLRRQELLECANMHHAFMCSFWIYTICPSQKTDVVSEVTVATEVGRVSRNKRHRQTLKLMDGVQKDLVKGRDVCKSFSLFFFAFSNFPGSSGCNEGSIKRHGRKKKGNQNKSLESLFWSLGFWISHLMFTGLFFLSLKTI